MSQPSLASGAESSNDDELEPPRYGERVSDPDRAATTWAGPSDDTHLTMADSRATASGAVTPGAAAAGAVTPGAVTPGAATPDATTSVPSPAAPGVDGSPAGTAPLVPPTENVVRGLLCALIVIPVGVAVWVLLWQVGFIASIVSFGVAWAAVRLYRAGSRGAVTRGAFWGIVGIIVVTLVVSMLAAIVSDLISATGLSVSTALASNRFWSLYWHNIFTNGRMWAAYLPNILMMLLFGALGCFSTVRRLARESRRISDPSGQPRQR